MYIKRQRMRCWVRKRSSFESRSMLLSRTRTLEGRARASLDLKNALRASLREPKVMATS